jgi:hypothetical protein
MGYALRKVERLLRARLLYFQSPQGITDSELAKVLGIERTVAYDYRKELGATATTTPGRYTLEPTQEDIDIALAILQRVHS